MSNRWRFAGPTRAAGPVARWTLLALLPIFAGLPGCRREPATAPSDVVVVYTSIDERFAREILALAEEQTGIRVEVLTDTEAGKTTGLLRRLQREAANPRCDVWWSGEVFGTVELARAGLFTPYDSPAAADIPPEWRDPEHRWTALAARARVVAFNTHRLTAAELPTTWAELADPRWAGRLAFANPQFGTTRGHLAAMFAAWGEEQTASFLRALRAEGTQIADGNAHAVRLVASGAADLCATDTDDVWVAQQRGEPIDLVYPRLEPDGPIVWIPCSVAIVAGGPNPDAARRLVDYLVSAEAEEALAASDSQNVPVRPDLRRKLSISGPEPAAIDFEWVADALAPSARLARDILLE